MIKWIKIFLTGVLVSMFFFPFEFTFLPTVNTKMAMAVVGLGILLVYLVRQGDLSIPKELLVLLFLAGSVSLISLFTMVYNRTPDAAYVTYIVSASVWLSSAFVVCVTIRGVHGRLDVPLIIYYFTAVCVFQCIIALVIDYNIAVQQFVDRWIVGGEFYHEIKRLYGIGAGLDIAGTRFSCDLIAIAFLLSRREGRLSWKNTLLLFVAFVVVSVIGNMIARTTLVGMALGIVLLAISATRLINDTLNSGVGKLMVISFFVALVAVPAVIFFYNSDQQFQELMRFGFEGFFSLAETGEWHVSSNDMLEGMIVWPDDIETWIIGDGYFQSQRWDPNYVGDAPIYEAGYYMGTDVGYCRFIFYFGVIGLIAISTVITYAALTCSNAFGDYKVMFLIVLLAGFIMWWKSSTDIFLFFAVFVCCSFLNSGEDEEEEESQEPVAVRRGFYRI